MEALQGRTMAEVAQDAVNTTIDPDGLVYQFEDEPFEEVEIDIHGEPVEQEDNDPLTNQRRMVERFRAQNTNRVLVDGEPVGRTAYGRKIWEDYMTHEHGSSRTVDRQNEWRQFFDKKDSARAKKFRNRHKDGYQ